MSYVGQTDDRRWVISVPCERCRQWAAFTVPHSYGPDWMPKAPVLCQTCVMHERVGNEIAATV